MERATSTDKAPKPVLVVCPKCKGAQFIRSARCRECKGSGKIEVK